MKTNFVDSVRRALLVVALATCAVWSGFSSTSSHAASASADATATVIVPIAISKNADLVFGKFAAGTGGTVVMSTAGARSSTGGVVLSTVTPGNAASFTVSGDANATYTITLPGNTTLTGGGGADTMTAGTFVSNPSGTGTLSGAGSQTLLVGATLTVGNAQAAGAYTGSFSVTVEYN